MPFGAWLAKLVWLLGLGPQRPSRKKPRQQTNLGVCPAWTDRGPGSRCSAQLCLSRSAGIGRTGCFIATRMGCQQLKDKGEVDVLGIVCRLRIDRCVLRPGSSSEGPAGCQAWEEGCGGGHCGGHGDNF